MSDKKKPQLPPNFLNKLRRSSEPMIADLQGPGPFQLPLLTEVEGVMKVPPGQTEIRLETEKAQAVHLVLTEQAASVLYDFLKVYFQIQERDAPKKKN